MSATIKLQCVRFVKRVSSGGSLSKYGYIGMMQRNGEALKAVPWLEAASPIEAVTLTTNQLTKTDGKASEDGAWERRPSYTAYMGDVYDAYCQAGDAVARNATMCGYAGCVAYRFELPESSGANALESVALALQRDRYLRAGVRVAACLSDSDVPSDDWDVVRGEAEGCVKSSSTAPGEGVVGVSSFGFLGQTDVGYLTASSAAAGTLEIDTSSAFADAASFAFLYVYVTLEDPAAYWNLYNADEIRQYYIEGSAMLVADSCTFTFASDPGTSPTSTEIVVAEGFAPAGALDTAYDTAALADCALAYVNGTPRTAASGAAAALIDTAAGQSPENLLAAVRQAYAMFHAGQTSSPDAFDDSAQDGSRISAKLIDAGVPGASFCVCVNPDLARWDPEQRTGCVILSRRVALHRFVVPSGFTPTAVRFEWEPVVTSGDVRLSAWMKVGADFVPYGDAGIRDAALFSATVADCGEWRRIASFRNRATYQTDGTKTRTVPFPSGVAAGAVVTILLTAYAEPTASRFAAGDVIGMVKDAAGRDVRATLVATAGWRPTITLIK